ncbi:MAG: hypothetical protein LQ349_001613 [Xanthoria aureola]|nr:MAG: hypothetical protein LQ349_001613 [Xanthoria aureola]
MRHKFLATVLFLLTQAFGTHQVDVIITHRRTINQPATVICRNLAPGVCCRRIWISYNDGATSQQQGIATTIEFDNLLVGDIAAIWQRPGPVSRPRNGNDCSTRILRTGHGPGRFTSTSEERAQEPGGGSYISVGQMKLPPGTSTASALLIQGIFGLVWGGGQWFGSAAATRKYGSGGGRGLKPKKSRRGVVLSGNKGTVYASPPTRWVDPDLIRVNGTEYFWSAVVAGPEELVYRDDDGVVLDLTSAGNLQGR